MDIHFLNAKASDLERVAIDAYLDTVLRAAADAPAWLTSSGSADRARRTLVLPSLHAANDAIGWLSEGAINYIAQRLDLPPADVYGVATFYSLFATKPRPPQVVHICTDLACALRGADELLSNAQDILSAAIRSATSPDDVARDAAATGEAGLPSSPFGAEVQSSPCLGLCERAPAVLSIRAGTPPAIDVIAPASRDAIAQMLTAARYEFGAPTEPPAHAAAPQIDLSIGGHDRTQLRLLQRVGVVDPASLDSYRAHGGYRALARSIELGPAWVIEQMVASKLLGRGGAAFPAGRKWAAVAAQQEPRRYLVCNADESEPGTFKDRVLLEADPFAVIEAMTIAALATGCQTGYVYLRGEYPRAAQMLRGAIEAARGAGLLGPDVMGSGATFDIELFRGAGAYICGEETAIFNSIEGYRGEPRSKPPFPVERGLFGCPTLVNNVETLANVLPIVLDSGAAFAATGTADSTGTKLFCVSGCVARPGVYEVPFGTTLAQLLQLAGGTAGGEALQAVLLGGAAGSFVDSGALDVSLTFEGTRSIGATLGSGVVMVFDTRADLSSAVLRIASFFRDESCGQCVPCRVGTVRVEEALQRMRLGGDRAADRALLDDLGRVLRDASICGLGQTAYNAIDSALRNFEVFA